MDLKHVFGAAAVAGLFGIGAANAATISTTFQFDLVSSGTQTVLNYSIGDLDLTVTNLGGNQKVETWKNYGLGAPTDSHHQVDSYGIAETIKLAFSKAVKLTNVTFNPTYVQSWDKFELFEDGASQGVQQVQNSVNLITALLDNFGIGAHGSDTFWTTSALHWNSSNACYKLGYSYSKGKYQQQCYSAFKITSVTVEYDDTPVIPLPAGGLLLVSALGALGALRRRKARTAA